MVIVYHNVYLGVLKKKYEGKLKTAPIQGHLRVIMINSMHIELLFHVTKDNREIMHQSHECIIFKPEYNPEVWQASALLTF